MEVKSLISHSIDARYLAYFTIIKILPHPPCDLCYFGNLNSWVFANKCLEICPWQASCTNVFINSGLVMAPVLKWLFV